MDAHRWWPLFKLLQRHHVSALASLAVERMDVPREVKIPWLNEREKAIDWYCYQLEVQRDIVSIMQKHGIETVVLKGTCLAQYYPWPELREFGDLDLYFPCHKEADDVAHRVMGVDIVGDVHHHTKYDYRGVTVESHYDFFNIHYPGSNRRYNRMLASRVSSPTFDVLHFIRHAAIHFADNGLKLRDLCDWALLVSRDKDVDWNTVKSEVGRFGMNDFVATLDRVTYTWLGVASPLRLGAPNGAAERMVDDIFNSHSQKDGFQQYFQNHWKRKLAFGDSAASLLFHKAVSRLSH